MKNVQRVPKCWLTYGEKNEKKSKKYFGKGFLLMILASLISGVAVMLCILAVFYVMVPIMFFIPIFAYNPDLSIGDIISLSRKKSLHKKADEINITKNGFEKALILPSNLSKIQSPIVYTIPLQLLAYYTALHKGNDVDQPRNLAKAVTVE